MEAPRSFGGKGGGGGGYKESGLHILYLLANSLLCLKGSGDRGGSAAVDKSCSRAISGTLSRDPSFAEEAAGLSTQQPLTLLDERHPQRVPAAPSATGGWGMVGGGGGGGGRDAPFSPAELSLIRTLALSECAFPLMVHSLCPTIFGHELVKAGLLLGLFGGSSYKSRPQAASATAGVGGGSRAAGSDEQERGAGGAGGAKEFQVRADIHVLVVGDPGLGKVLFIGYL